MTLPLPDPLVARHRDAVVAGDDRDHTLSAWGVQRNLDAIAQRFPLGPSDLHFGGTVTSLPTGVEEGWEVNYVADSSNGVLWRCKYLPTISATYPWLVVGAPLYAYTSSSNAVASATYGSVGLSVTVPLAGDYLIHYGGKIDMDADFRDCYLTVKNGSNAAADADAINVNQDGASSHYIPVSTERKFTCAASASMALYARAAAGTVGTRDKFMRVTPIRVA